MRTRNRMVVALAGTLCLVLAACGSRLDHQTIVGAAATSGSGQGVAAEGQGGGALGDDLGDGARAGKPGAGADPGAGAGPGAGTSAGGSGREGGSGGKNGGPGGGPSGGPPLVIGTVGSFSGGPSDLLVPGGRAVQAWAADINSKGGVGGRKVKVVVRDDGGDPGRAKAVMRQFVEEDKVVAVVGAFATSESISAWRGYMEEKGVPVIGGLCGIAGWDGSTVMFRQCPAQPTLVFGAAKLGATHAKSKALGGLFCTEIDGCSLVEKQLFDEGFAKRAGLDPRYRAKISLFQADFTAECLRAKENGVGLLWVVGDAGTISRVASSCNRQNYHPQFISGAGALQADTVTKPGLGDMLVGSPVFPFAGLSTPAFREFEAVWKRYSGGSAQNEAAAEGWSSAKLFEKAAGSAGGDITSASLSKALRGLKNERLGGLTVPLNYGPKGAEDVKCIYFMRGSGGKWAAPNGDKATCW